MVSTDTTRSTPATNRASASTLSHGCQRPRQPATSAAADRGSVAKQATPGTSASEDACSVAIERDGFHAPARHTTATFNAWTQARSRNASAPSGSTWRYGTSRGSVASVVRSSHASSMISTSTS